MQCVLHTYCSVRYSPLSLYYELLIIYIERRVSNCQYILYKTHCVK